ncbi:hypothetical protein GS451_07140 [Rhodococcus hoagii]|nr:hypothetical protein [Prescottella equi]
MAELFRFLRSLPAWSEYKSAMAMDPELAKHWADQYDPDDTTPPVLTPAGFTPELRELRDVVNHLKKLTATLLAVNGNKVGRLDLKPYPTTALELELKRRDDAEVDEHLARLGAT